MLLTLPATQLTANQSSLQPTRLTLQKIVILAASVELIVLVFEKDIERSERTVTTGNILLQVELVGIA
jgi:hypothetical protein